MWTRWDDIDRMFHAMDLLQSKMNRVFSDVDRFGTLPAAWSVRERGPRTNLYDAGDYLEIKAEVPGITKDDLSIRIQGNYLEIAGTRKSDAPEGYAAHRVERATVSFTRSFTLPADVDSGKAEASLKNGLLSLKLPKLEAAKPKKIAIN